MWKIRQHAKCLRCLHAWEHWISFRCGRKIQRETELWSTEMGWLIFSNWTRMFRLTSGRETEITTGLSRGKWNRNFSQYWSRSKQHPRNMRRLSQYQHTAAGIAYGHTKTHASQLFIRLMQKRHKIICITFDWFLAVTNNSLQRLGHGTALNA